MFRPLPMLAAIAFGALAVSATAHSQPQPKTAPKSGSTNPQPQPTDLAVTAVSIQPSADRVTVTVRFDSRIGLRGVPVKLTVAGGGRVQFEKTERVDMPLNSTHTVTFKVPFDAIKGRIPQPPLQAVRFLTVTATVDPDGTIGEDNETNNKLVRIVTF